jgi:hypothetical protein
MIPNRIVARAGAILTSQSFVPLSPAATGVNGDICLCAAASLAFAGIETEFGSAAADEFRATICSMSSKGLEEVFERLGWTPSLCAAIREPNDAASPDDRLGLVITKLEELIGRNHVTSPEDASDRKHSSRA